MRNYCMNCMMPLEEQGKPCPHCGYASDGHVIPHQLRPGTLLNRRFLVGNAIGQGGFGITYIGRDTKLDMKIAVKEYYPTGYANRNTLVSPDITITSKDQLSFIEEGKEKFLQEARTLAKFNENASVVNVHDYFEANQTVYIAMEYLDGQDLRRCLKKNLFTADQIFELMAPILDALERIHGENMIHRDISPDNIMMLKNGTLKLMDFGATRQVNFLDQKSVSVVLKAGFAPEEQYRSKGIQGPWTDIYALCATIYKCITGITPDDSLQRSSKDEIRWPSELGFPITARQEAVLKKGLAVKQQDRFQNIGEIKAMLSGDSDSPVPSITVQTGGKSERGSTVSADEEDMTVHIGRPGSKQLADEEDPTEYISRPGSKQPADGEDATEYIGHLGSKQSAGEGGHPPLNGPGTEQPADGERAATRGGAVMREQSELEETPKTSASGHSGMRKPIIAGICAAVILLVVIAVIALHGGSDPARETGPGNVQSADVTEEPGQELGVNPELDRASMYHITLTVGNQVTVREYNAALPILTERLDLFTGGEPYEMTVEDGSIDLYLPKSAFGEVGIEQALKCYITRATDLYIFDKATAKLGIYLKKEALNRSDLESVILMEGTIEGVDATQYGIDAPTYQYIEVTLTDECAQRYSEEIAEWGENLALGQDLDYTNFYYHYTFPAGDGKTFYILNNDVGGHFAELVVYNFTHAPLPYSFGVSIDLDSSVEWQSPEEASVTGENQCEASELTGNTVTVLYKYYTKDLTVGELLDLETEMKARLDILEQPYAYGEVEDETSLILAVQTGLEHMGGSVISLIGGTGSPCFRANLAELSVDCETFGWEKGSDGTYCVTLKVASDYHHYADRLAKLSGWLAEQGGGTLFLTNSGQMPLLSADVGQQIEDGIATFNHICFEGHGTGANITDEDIWFLRLLDRVWNKSQSSKSLSAGDIQMNLEGKVTSPDESRYGVSNAQKAQAITNAILTAAPDASIRIDGRSVAVTLDLEVNENLPETATATAQDIYEASGFDTSVYNSLSIYLVDEDNSVVERARIFFSKRTNSYWNDDESVTDGFIYVHGIFVNGRLERYQDAFKNIVETDPFYTGLTVEDSTNWTWTLDS